MADALAVCFVARMAGSVACTTFLESPQHLCPNTFHSVGHTATLSTAERRLGRFHSVQGPTGLPQHMSCHEPQGGKQRRYTYFITSASNLPTCDPMIEAAMLNHEENPQEKSQARAELPSTRLITVSAVSWRAEHACSIGKRETFKEDAGDSGETQVASNCQFNWGILIYQSSHSLSTQE